MKPLPDKKQIIDSIAKVATRLGRAPSLLEFSTRARIPRRFVFRFFPKWNDALKAAGLPPRKPHMKIEDSELLKDWGEATRKKQGVLPRRAYPLFGKCDPSTLAKRFGEWSSIPRAFRKFAKGKPEWADVMALLPAPTLKRRTPTTKRQLGFSHAAWPAATRGPKRPRNVWQPHRLPRPAP